MAKGFYTAFIFRNAHVPRHNVQQVCKADNEEYLRAYLVRRHKVAPGQIAIIEHRDTDQAPTFYWNKSGLFKCENCNALGFEPSKQLGCCTFCDGTTGGHPPTETEIINWNNVFLGRN